MIRPRDQRLLVAGCLFVALAIIIAMLVRERGWWP